MNKIGYYFARLFFLISLHCGLYAAWSKVYRWLYLRQFKKYPIKSYNSMPHLISARKRLVWKEDGLRELFDALESPQYVQAIIDGKQQQPNHGTDCDSFAIWSAAAIMTSKFPNIKNATLLTISWQDTKGVAGGHNVCLITWIDGKYSYTDYEDPSTSRSSIEDVVKDVLWKYAGKGYINLGWAVFDNVENLKVIKTGKI